MVVRLIDSTARIEIIIFTMNIMDNIYLKKVFNNKMAVIGKIKAK